MNRDSNTVKNGIVALTANKTHVRHQITESFTDTALNSLTLSHIHTTYPQASTPKIIVNRFSNQENLQQK